MCLVCFLGHLRSTKDVTAGNGVGHTCPIHLVALHTDVAHRIGINYEHDREGRENVGTGAEDILI